MPQKVLCSGCGKVIFESEDIKPPDEILDMYNGKCPYCGKELSFTPLNVEIKVA